MKRFVKLISLVLLSFMALGIMIGYAVIADTLLIKGNINLKKKEFQGIYISSVEVYSQSGVSSVSFDYIKPTNLQTDVVISSQNASVTYAITVYNNTDVTYWYLGIQKFNDFGANDLIDSNGGIFISTKDTSSANSVAFDTSDWVPPQTERVFYATYSYGPRATGTVSNLVNFSFGLHMDAVHDGFLSVLNDKVSEYGYYYLADAFDDKYANEGKTVIGNVGDDAAILNKLFGSNPTIKVDGVDMPVTIMIERKNVDKSDTGDSYSGVGAPSGCEYTIYITVDDLKTSGGTATVYAVSYTCGADGYWYQLAELYEGTALKEDYDTSNNTYDGSFNVGSWVASEKVYEVTDKISYKVGYEQGTEYDKYTSIEQLMSCKDQEFYNKVNNSSQDLLKPVCNILYSYVHNNGRYIESENTANKYNQGYSGLKAAFDKIKPYCLIANGAQEVKIQNASSLTRAELIQFLEAIQNAYDYYRAVNAG